MLTTLRLGSVLLGLGVGSFVSTTVALLGWAVLAALGLDEAADIGLVAGIVVGLVAGGFTAGRTALVAHRFNGMVTGLGLAALVLVIARLGGSPASTPRVLLLAVIAIGLGGLGGVIGGRRRANRP